MKRFLGKRVVAANNCMKSKKALEFLLGRGASINAQSNDGSTALHKACAFRAIRAGLCLDEPWRFLGVYTSAKASYQPLFPPRGSECVITINSMFVGQARLQEAYPEKIISLVV